MPEMVQNHLESVCIDIRSCLEKFGTSGTSRTGDIGCIQKWPNESRFFVYKLGQFGDSNFGHVYTYFEVSKRFDMIDIDEN